MLNNKPHLLWAGLVRRLTLCHFYQLLTNPPFLLSPRFDFEFYSELTPLFSLTLLSPKQNQNREEKTELNSTFFSSRSTGAAILDNRETPHAHAPWKIHSAPCCSGAVCSKITQIKTKTKGKGYLCSRKNTM